MHRFHVPPRATTDRAGRRSSRPNQADLTARASRNVPVRISFPHPLSWWRTRRADEFKEADVFIARHFLTRSAIIGEPHWFLGAVGDAAVAIGVALRTQRQCGETLVSLDLAMTAVLCVALEGDAAATLLLSATLKRRSGIDPLCRALSDTWLTSRSRKRASRSKPDRLLSG
jgi:hypothetical protein